MLLSVGALVGAAQGSSHDKYGTPWAASSLSNIHIGGTQESSGRRVSHRFRAKYTGAIQSFRPYWVANQEKPGYAGGTGGTIRMDIVADDGTDNHAPTSTPLGSVTKTFQLQDGGRTGFARDQWFELYTLPTPVEVTAGQLYHIVFTNLDPNPGDNYISLNYLHLERDANPPPGESLTNWSVLIDDGNGWVNQHTAGFGANRYWTPITEITYTDLRAQGVGYMEVWTGEHGKRTVNQSQWIRETFTASRSFTTQQVNLRVQAEEAGSVLVAELQEADGTVLATGSTAAVEGSTSHPMWHRVSFAEPVSLREGTGYNLIFRSSSGSFIAYPLRDGGSFGYGPSSVFAEGYAEASDSNDSAWTGVYGWSAEPSKHGDWQFYFDVMP